MLFKATVAVNTVCQITKKLLEDMDVKALLLDLDNTLTTHDNHKPAKGVPEWLSIMREAGIGMVIVSNNRRERVEPFALMLKLDFVCDGKKPLPKGFNEAQKRLGLPFNNLAVVGDQIFTDILGANLKRIKSIYVDPIEHEGTTFFKIKRRLEIPFIPKTRLDLPTAAKTDTKR